MKENSNLTEKEKQLLDLLALMFVKKILKR